MDEPKSINLPVKIAAAALTILAFDAAIITITGDRVWNGLDTLLTAAALAPLAALLWPPVEMGGYIVLFGIDYARKAIWERRQKELAQAQAEEERLQSEQARALAEAQAKGLEKGRAEGHEEGYRLGYQAGVSDERLRSNGHGYDWMFGGGEYDNQ